jgi:tetratricopeptide (TPR) repeat protein
MALLAVDRYATADALADDLRRWLAGEPIVARPLSTATRAARWIGRHRLVATLSACLLVVAGGALVRLRQGAITLAASVSDVALLADKATLTYDTSLLGPARSLGTERAQLAEAGDALRRLYEKNPTAYYILVYLGRVEARLGRLDEALRLMTEGIDKLGPLATGPQLLERVLLRTERLMSKEDLAPEFEKLALADLAEARLRGLGLQGDRAEYVDAVEKFLGRDARACLAISDRLLSRSLPPLLRADVLCLKGYASFLLDDSESAARDLDAAAEIKRCDRVILIGVAVARYRLPHLPPAIDAARRALVIDPLWNPAWIALGTLWEMQGEADLARGLDPAPAFEEAAAALRHATGPLARAESARLHIGRARWTSSIAELQAAIAIDASELNGFLNRAEAYSMLAEFDGAHRSDHILKAIELYDELVHDYPMHAPVFAGRGLALRKRANFLWEAGQLPEASWNAAIADFDRALTLDAREQSSHEQRGMLFFTRATYRGAQGRDYKADAVEAEASLTRSSSLTSLCARAHVRLLRGALDDALADARRAIERAPTLAMAHATLGDVLLARGDRKAALASYRRAVEFDAKLATALKPSMAECEK